MSKAIKEAEKILKQYYGYDHFREGQISVIEAVLEGRDVLGIMPTGAGKSVCYQVPALMMNGITIVISPLISLMKDQVGTLNQMGVHAAFLNSSLTSGQYYKALQLAKQGRYKIIYVAPERLETESFLDFALSEQVQISFVAVDEAHCVSQWGQDFRPGYLKILDFLNRLAYRPVVGAYTATATVIDIVHGGKSQKILGKNLDKNPEYAVLSERTVPRLRQILRELQFREYVEEKGEQYPVICLTPEGKAFMKTEEPLIMKLPKEETEKKSESKEKKNRRKKGAVAAELSEKEAELFESLRELRREIASEEKVPPYMVFVDKTLAGMCVMRPATRDEMLEVSGVGEHKLEKYGDRFLEILRKG